MSQLNEQEIMDTVSLESKLVALINDKFEQIQTGVTVVVSDGCLDMLDRISCAAGVEITSIPNPAQVGVLDAYLAYKVPALLPNEGRLWWVADDRSELNRMINELVGKGCVMRNICPQNDGSSRIDYVFGLDRSRAEEILGFVPGEEDWLED